MSEPSGIRLKITRIHPRDDGKGDVIAQTEAGSYYLLAAVSPPFPELESDVVIPSDWSSDPDFSGRVAKIEFPD